MGLLALGTPLPWSEAKKHADYVREHGIEQFLSVWEKLKDRTGDRLMWGDEVSPFSYHSIGFVFDCIVAMGGKGVTSG